MNIKELSQKRFSARKYTAEPVSREDIDYIMECVRMAPSAVNRQPWKFIIVSSEEARQKLWHTYEREWFRTALHRLYERQQRMLDTSLRQQATRRH